MISSCPIFIDDGRHFLRASTTRYDAILIDCFAGERIPGHLFTREAFQTIRERLTERGIVLINYVGYVTGARGYGCRSIGRTMREAGLQVRVAATGPDEEQRSLIIAGGIADPALGEKNRQNPCCEDFSPALLAHPIDLFAEPGTVLTDDRGELELFNVEYHELLRKRVMQHLPWALMVEE
jgi:hypothetical protein